MAATGVNKLANCPDCDRLIDTTVNGRCPNCGVEILRSFTLRA